MPIGAGHGEQQWSAARIDQQVPHAAVCSSDRSGSAHLLPARAGTFAPVTAGNLDGVRRLEIAGWSRRKPGCKAGNHPRLWRLSAGALHLDYPAPGAPEVAEKAASLLEQAGYRVIHSAHRGLDHGA